MFQTIQNNPKNAPVHFSVHFFNDLKTGKKYNISLYTGGGSFKEWSSLSKEEQAKKLNIPN